MRNIRLVIEYDGTSYAGWQLQPNGITIQEVLEKALARMLGHPVRITGAGRTDAGVHARGMVAAFTTERTLPLQAFSAGLNNLLPSDVAIADADEVPLAFHPRFDAAGKHYRYTIYNAPHRSPLNRFTSWHLRGELDLQSMRQAAAAFVGEHDYAAFRTTGCAGKTTVRTVWSVDINTESPLVTIDVKGRGFLRNMVRIMAGTLVEVGLGKREAADVAALLQTPPQGRAGATAPPHGLCLMEVYYPDPSESAEDFLLDTPG